MFFSRTFHFLYILTAPKKSQDNKVKYSDDNDCDFFMINHNFDVCVWRITFTKIVCAIFPLFFISLCIKKIFNTQMTRFVFISAHRSLAVYSVVIFSHRYLDSDCINFKTFVFLATCWSIWTSSYNTDIKVQPFFKWSLNNVKQCHSGFCACHRVLK